MLSSNTFSLSELYAHESATYQAVFGDFLQIRNSTNSNRIILVSKNGLSNTTIDTKNIARLDARLTPYNVNIEQLHQNIVSTENNQNWPQNTRVLTDQFSPANLLNSK